MNEEYPIPTGLPPLLSARDLTSVRFRSPFTTQLRHTRPLVAFRRGGGRPSAIASSTDSRNRNSAGVSASEAFARRIENGLISSADRARPYRLLGLERRGW